MKYRSKPVVIEAHRWFKNGDHPEDECRQIQGSEEVFLSEGKIVRYFRHPNISGSQSCKHCGVTMHDHGWIDTLEGGHIVCPGGWIIRGTIGEFYPCKDEVFRQKYEEVGE